ncbi:hypothetical protein B0H14DRAFT_2773520 [Mycena olivaceomarginata]|nr:hypothetical protein B0H14DRAFT_2773520 [Mycena olivaceomarginata]
MAFSISSSHPSATHSCASFLAQLPEEIIEYITECMRYPIYPRFEATDVFLTEGRTGFSDVRFSLSSFSKVCKFIRSAVERLLYRDIHLDIVSWTRHVVGTSDTQKHPMWPAACLHLLLRTLEERPDLRRFVRSVALRWSLWPQSTSKIEQQLEFLRLCPGLQSLSFSVIPEAVLQFLEPLSLQITSFAAVSSAADVPHIIRVFPNLTNLHLHVHGRPSSLSIPDHKISGLSIALIDPRDSLLQLAFAVARGVKAFHLTGDRKAFPLPTPSMQASVQHMRLKTINPFTSIKINDTVYFPLAVMTTLHHLHVMRPDLLHIYAFRRLPPSLRSITFSDYGLDSTKPAADSKSCFVQSVVDCINANSQSVKLAGIKTYGAIPDDPWELGDLTPVRSLCLEGRVPFIQIGAYADIEPELMIFCELVLSDTRYT